MAPRPDNPGILILLVFAVILFASVAIPGSIDGDLKTLGGLLAGGIIVGLFFTALRAPATGRTTAWVAFATGTLTLLYLVNLSVTEDAVLAVMPGLLSAFLAAPFFLALADQRVTKEKDEDGPPGRE